MTNNQKQWSIRHVVGAFLVVILKIILILIGWTFRLSGLFLVSTSDFILKKVTIK